MHLLLILGSVLGHMEMTNPIIPKSRYNDALPWYSKDYTNIFPIGSQYYQSLQYCHHAMDRVHIQKVTAGATITSHFNGDADHEGGHCEFALSYGGGEFAVLRTILTDCLANGARSYDFDIPASAPTGIAILSWTWYNRIGEREIYMNCAKLQISGTRNGVVRGPRRLIANLPGFPVIHQFKFSVKGVHLYRNRPTIETGVDAGGNGYSRQISPIPAPANLPGKDYFFDPYHPNVDPTQGLPSYSKDENVDD